jgi:benzylsuccinate CoA-transferase BbsF subunit
VTIPAEQRLLQGLRVLDFSWLLAGPSGTLQLALNGADVIRVESRRSLDNFRRSFTIGGDPDRSHRFATLNFQKRSVVIDLKSEVGLDLIFRLARECDVVVENFSPGTMEKLGVGYPQLREANPRIVMVSASAAGQTGPKKHFSGYAPNFAALAGLAHLTGHESGAPARYGRALDARVGAHIALAALIGVLWREQTGTGVYLDISDQEVVASLIGDVLTDAAFDGEDRHRSGNTDPFAAGSGCYACLGDDQWIAIEIASDAEWAALCRALDRPELVQDAGLATIAGRWSRREDIEAAIAAWAARLPKREAESRLRACGVRATVVADARDIFDDQLLRERRLWRTTEHAALGTLWVIDSPVRLASAADGSRTLRPAPLLGEHSSEVLQEVLGMSPEEVANVQDVLR